MNFGLKKNKYHRIAIVNVPEMYLLDNARISLTFFAKEKCLCNKRTCPISQL